MIARTEALWLRALRAADARGLLPANEARYTPAELASEAARRGDDRLAQFVDGWYYPASFGRIGGVLSDDDAGRLVAALETDVAGVAFASVPPVEDPPRLRKIECDLCGSPVAPS